MFNLGFSEMIFLAVIALIVIGPKQLPEVARVVARLLNDLKRATSDVTKPFADLKNEAQEMAHLARNSVVNFETEVTESVRTKIEDIVPNEEQIKNYESMKSPKTDNSKQADDNDS